MSYQLSALGDNAAGRCSVGAVLDELCAHGSCPGGDARRDARQILAFLLDRSAAWVGAHAGEPVSDEIRARAVQAARRAASGAPLEYAVGRAAFRDLVLEVDERVLIPRAETEIVVEEALRACRAGVTVDVGTGSGAIALALATEGDFHRVIGTDVSTDALAVAAKNVQRLDIRGTVELQAGWLLQPIGDLVVDLVVSNPPYIAAREMRRLPCSVRDWEPPIALLSGEDGFTHSDAIARDAARVLRPGGWLVLEADAQRAQLLAQRIAGSGPFTDLRVRPDLAGRDRVVMARKRS